MTGSTRPRRGAAGRTAAWSALVVAAAATLVATLPAPPPAEEPTTAATLEPVSRVVLSCPSGHRDAVVKVASVAGLPTKGAGGGEIAVDQPGEDSPSVTVERGALAAAPVTGTPAQVRASGAAARGLLAVRGERVGGTLATAGCRAAQPEWWFSGAGGGVDHTSVLFLTNADDGPAVVEVRLHGASGSIDEAGTRGLTVAPGETLKLPLTEYAPGSDELAVQVVSTRGRVVAHLLDTVRSSRGEGREWLAPSPPPAEELVLPGVPEDADRVQLLVTNPGAEQALVDFELLTEDGAFVPLGSEQLSVEPGTIQQIDVTEALKGRAAAVRLTALVPVTGAVRVARGGDVSYAAAGVPLAEAGEAGGVVLAGEDSEIQVAAADEPVALELDLYADDGRRVLRRAVTVPPSGLVRVAAQDGAAYAVLRPRSGAGYAAVVHTGPGVAGQPVTMLATTLVRPSVVPYAGQSDS